MAVECQSFWDCDDCPYDGTDDCPEYGWYDPSYDDEFYDNPS